VRDHLEGTFEFFIDYELDASILAAVSLVPSLGVTDLPFLIGCDNDSYGLTGDGQFVGQIDTIRVSNGALAVTDFVGGENVVITPLVDLNGDGLVNGEDVSALYDHFGDTDLSWDFNGDLTVDFDDVIYLLTEMYGTALGDTNIDGKVDGTDLSVMAGGFAGPGGYHQGDLNADGLIDGVDLSRLAQAFDASSTSAVPEPMTALLLLSASGCLLRYRRQ